MKHSRFFLGISTALLAIAGVAAAKAHRGIAVTAWFYTKASPIPAIQTCPYFKITKCTKESVGPQCFYTTTLGTSFPFYTQGGVHVVCRTPVKYNAL